jgi:hypothetical protein
MADSVVKTSKGNDRGEIFLCPPLLTALGKVSVEEQSKNGSCSVGTSVKAFWSQ